MTKIPEPEGPRNGKDVQIHWAMEILTTHIVDSEPQGDDVQKRLVEVMNLLAAAIAERRRVNQAAPNPEGRAA